MATKKPTGRVKRKQRRWFSWLQTGSPRDIYFVSDIHLTENEEHTGGWMSHKSAQFNPDPALVDLMEYANLKATHPVDLVFNGDFIDFRTIVHRPDGEKNAYGLPPTKKNSVWKLKWVFRYHTEFFLAMARFVLDGNRVHIVAGNHDLEFNFAAVRRAFRVALWQLVATKQNKSQRHEFFDQVRFYRNHIFEKDLYYAEHGHMYDPFCSLPEERTLIHNPDGSVRLLLPFGDLTSKYLSNTLGYFNPYDATSFALTLKEYVKLFFRMGVFNRHSMPISWAAGSIRAFWQAWKDNRVISERLFITKDRKITISKSQRQKIRALRRKSAIFNLPLIVRTLRIDLLLIGLAVALVLFSPLLSFYVTGALLVAIPYGWTRWHTWNKKNRLPGVGPSTSTKTALRLRSILDVPYVVLGHTHMAAIKEGTETVTDTKKPFDRKWAVIDTGTWAPIFQSRKGERLWSRGRTYFHIKVRKKEGVSHEFKQWTDNGPTDIGWL